MESLGSFVGALIATFIVSRILILLLPKRDGREIAAFFLSLAICWALVAFGSANGGPPVWEAGWTYVVPQIVWLCVDLFRLHSRQQDAPAPASPQAPPTRGEPGPGELAFWNSIASSTDAADFEAYLAQFPAGHFKALAHNRLRRLSGETNK